MLLSAFSYCVCAEKWDCGVKERFNFNCLGLNNSVDTLSPLLKNQTFQLILHHWVFYIDIFLKYCWFEITGHIKLMVLEDK